MCGIGGFLGEGNVETLQRMSGTLSRRGPDDNGVFLEHGVGFVHTRLAIIDLSSLGHQPMVSSSKRTLITFNGEIYNYRELRREIEHTGAYQFRTETDTEVILALYEMLGTAGFSKLNGMFAFALHDTSTETTYLVRDRLGKKPLYWGMFDGTLVFGSELKALMCHPLFKKEIDPAAVRAYLTYESIPTPLSIFKGVHKVGAGSYLTHTADGTLSETVYWDISHSVSDVAFPDALKELDVLMQASVERRLVSDVPLGVFLSGGLDSSAIAYYAQRVSGEQLKTFSVGFTDADFDESSYAALAAQSLGVAHTTERFSPERCLELIPEVFSYLDEPVGDAAILPTHLLSLFTRQHVTVALSGNGGDELFAGYPTFQAEKMIGIYDAIPRSLRRTVIEPLIRSLPVSHSYFSLDFKLKRFLDGADADPRYRHQRWLGAFNESEASALLGSDPDVAAESPYARLDQYFDPGDPNRDFHNDLLWAYARTYMMDEVLAMVDRASMQNALEIRSPFLDHELVEFVQGLPYDFKLHGFTGKYMLKQLMKGRLPDEIVNRKKKGFGVPIGRWLQKELKPLSDRLLSKASIEASGFFDHAIVQQLKAEHEGGTRDHRKKLWTLMVFQMWYEQWCA